MPLPLRSVLFGKKSARKLIMKPPIWCTSLGSTQTVLAATERRRVFILHPADTNEIEKEKRRKEGRKARKEPELN